MTQLSFSLNNAPRCETWGPRHWMSVRGRLQAPAPLPTRKEPRYTLGGPRGQQPNLGQLRKLLIAATARRFHTDN
jgi:hypothetical protein